MPVISFISPKGGVGKTTAATLLASQLATKTKVIVIDADPNHPIAAWAKLGGTPDNLKIVSDVNQESILERIEEASQEATFVVVDLEGTASLIVAYAIGASDLVVIPTQGSQLDASQAARALSLIKNQEKQSRRPIPHAVLLTRTNAALKPRTMKDIQEQLRKGGVDLFATQMNEREAFRSMFSFGGSLENLNPTLVPNLPKAIENAQAFAAEVIQKLREAGQGAHAADDRKVS